MPKYFKNKNTRYSKVYDLLGADLISAETENMYINHKKDGGRLESFPGYRKVFEIEGRIHGIYDLESDGNSILVHGGSHLYKCRFNDDHRDALTSTILCDMEDKKSLYYRCGDDLCFVNGEYINLIDSEMQGHITSQNSSKIYIPTTYVNGEEAEQFNLLSNKFKEEILNISEVDFAYESQGLKFRIISESEGTCAVVGVESGFGKTIEVPSRKMINGRYYKVVEISDRAFEDNTEIHKVILGGGVKRVGKFAFSGCENMHTVAMPDGIEIIDDSAFSGCALLSKIYVGSTLKSIYYNAFDSLSDNATFYLSGLPESYEKCDGIGNLMIYPVYYSVEFTGYNIGIPIYSPVKSISSVMIGTEKMEDGTEYSKEIKRGLIKIAKSKVGSLEGRSIYIEGVLDTSISPSSERGTPLTYFLGEDTTARAEILSSAGSEFFDGRAFIFAPKSFPNMILVSSFTREGKSHPLYFGSLDYFTVGSPRHPITDVKKEGGRLAVAKADERGGSIFLYQPKGDEGAVFGRRYSLASILEDTGIISKLFEFQKSTIFIGREGVCRMKYSTSSAVFETISSGCPREMINDLDSDVTFASLDGYIAIFSKYNMYLGDSRFTFARDGIDMRQFKWFPIKNIGSHRGDYREYFYASTAMPGTYIHPDMGKVVTGTVYSYVDEKGDTVYYVQIGPRKYHVLAGEELVGGELIGACTAISKGSTMFFGTECGEIFAFNTDKEGCEPRSYYTSKSHDSSYFEKAFKGRIHPSFYTHGEHRVRYSVTTPIYDGEVPYILKSNIRGSLVTRLGIMSAASVNFSVRDESGVTMELGGIPLGELDFFEMNFSKISFDKEDVEIVSVPEKQKKWAEKQITIYTNEVKAPFAISSVSHGFKIDGRIKNR